MSSDKTANNIARNEGKLAVLRVELAGYRATKNKTGVRNTNRQIQSIQRWLAA